MPDMLVKLYDLPPLEPCLEQMREQGVIVRHAMSYERAVVMEWVRRHFGDGWAAECEASFNQQPVTCFIAVGEGLIRGFACYEATARDFFGPTGVDPEWRGRGIGRALLLAALHGQKAMGYGYAIIGGAGPTEYYAKSCGATVIEGSSPGIYRDGLGAEEA
jgi:GNAT superfamily N-acetyltransferase